MSSEPVLYKYQAVKSWRFLSRFLKCIFSSSLAVQFAVFECLIIDVLDLKECHVLYVFIAEGLRSETITRNLSVQFASWTHSVADDEKNTTFLSPKQFVVSPSPHSHVKK